MIPKQGRIRKPLLFRRPLLHILYVDLMQKLKILSVFGTRPEAIKMAPLIHLLNQSHDIRHYTCSTGQHGEMMAGILKFFHLHPDYHLNVMTPGQSLNQLTAKLLDRMNGLLRHIQPDWVLVHGDTTTCFATALAAFHIGVKIGHVEAGLRSHQLMTPFPEEANRVMTDKLASAHFAPTLQNAENLIREGINPHTIEITGNTIIDALIWAQQKGAALSEDVPEKLKQNLQKEDFILVTCHRRENIESGLLNLCQALRNIARKQPGLQIIFPVHLNPRIQRVVSQNLRFLPNVHLLSPLNYPDFIWLLQQCKLILTDSGGVQEEAAALSKPLLVLRKATERVVSDQMMLVGNCPDLIQEQVFRLLSKEENALQKTWPSHPYGDGKASERIRAALLRLS